MLIIGLIWYRLTIDTDPYLDVWTQPYVEKIQAQAFIYQFFSVFTHFGSRIFLVPFAVIMSIPLFFLYRTMKPWLVICCGTLFTYVLNSSIKWVVQRERPHIAPEFAAEGFSFPSGHAMISCVFYSLLMYFLLRRFTGRLIRIFIWVFGIGFIGLIGTSRYVLHVHYASDIVVGYLMGIILLYFIVHLYGKKVDVYKR